MTIAYGIAGILLLLLWTYNPPHDEGMFIIAVTATWAYTFGVGAHALWLFARWTEGKRGD